MHIVILYVLTFYAQSATKTQPKRNQTFAVPMNK